MNHFSLFTGIGGIDLAAEWAGFETVGQCEFADYPTKVLEKHWPDVPRWRDVRDVTVQSIRERGINEITLLSGGFPCQPHSVAGKRQASADDRDLWGEFARIICETKPRWVLGENVPGLLSSEGGQFFGRILNDLAEMGYNAGWCMYGAAHVGALHKRERIFIMAYADGVRMEGQGAEQQAAGTCGESEVMAYTDNEGFQTGGRAEQTGRKIFGGHSDVSDAYDRSGVMRRDGTLSTTPQTERRWHNYRGRAAQHVTKEWQTEPNVGRVANGVPNRVDRVKALGNAVVPQQVYPILQTIADIEKLQRER